MRERGTRRPRWIPVPTRDSGEFLVRAGEELLSSSSRVRLTGPPNEIEVSIMASSFIGGILVMTPWFRSVALEMLLGNTVWFYLWAAILVLGSGMVLVGLWQPFRDPTRGANLKAIGLLAVATAEASYCIAVFVASPKSAILVMVSAGFLCIACIRRAVVVFKTVKKVLS